MTLGSLPVVSARDVPAATAKQMAQAENFASQELRIPLDALMDNASRQLAVAIRVFFDGVKAKDVLAIVGKGNNGGDALGALKLLRAAGAFVEAYTTTDRLNLGWLSGMRHDALARTGVALTDTSLLDDRTIASRLQRADIVIDGLLGYGGSGAPRGEIARVMRLMTAAARERIAAVDLPSGVNADTGRRLSRDEPDAIRAALTVTFGLLKTGLVTVQATPYVGDLLLADIGIPAAAYEPVGIDASGVFANGDLLHVVS